MVKLLLLVSLVLLAGCYETGYQPHYMISFEETERIPASILEEHSF